MNGHFENDQEGMALREQLKRAVRSESTPPYLEGRIRNAIRAEERRPSWVRQLIPLTAAVMVCLGGAIAYQLGHLRFTANSQESYIVSVSNRVATLMRVGLGDHLHCSVFRKFPKNPPTAQELAVSLGSEYSGLIPIVRKHVPEDYRMVIAHECRYHGRKFVHLSLRSDAGLMSLVIARKKDGESFLTEGMMPALTQSSIPFYRAGVQRFEITSFESRDHLVYFVSDLTKQQNMNLMTAMAPQVKEFLRAKEL